MKRILLATKNQNDTTAYLRAMGPFTEKSLRSEVLPIQAPNNYSWFQDWTFFYDVDCVFMHRPSTMVDLYVMEKAKLLGLPLWVDHDDDLENVPPQNPHKKSYGSQEIKVIRESYYLADLLTFGSERHLERVKKEHSVEGLHIANALDDRLLKFKKPFKKTSDTSEWNCAWRGSESHLSDLLYFQTEISEVIGKNLSKWFFRFIGINPFWVPYEVGHYPQTNLFEYYKTITTLNAQVHWVALEDNEFNRVKSNLSWLDATLAGSAVLAPNFEEFRYPGVALYEADVKRDFYREFMGMLNRGKSELEKMHDFSWEYIQDNLLLSKVNQTRRDIIKNL